MPTVTSGGGNPADTGPEMPQLDVSSHTESATNDMSDRPSNPNANEPSNEVSTASSLASKQRTPQITESFKLSRLPKVQDDYASIWWSEHNDGDIRPRLIQYNAYIQTLDDLSEGKLEIEGIDGKELTREIKRYIRSDFRDHALEGIDPSNHYHRALYAHCVKRYLDQLRYGVFEGPNRTKQTKPEVAEAITDHVNELFEKELLKGEPNHV